MTVTVMIFSDKIILLKIVKQASSCEVQNWHDEIVVSFKACSMGASLTLVIDMQRINTDKAKPI